MHLKSKDYNGGGSLWTPGNEFARSQQLQWERVMLVECERKYGRVEKFGRNWHGCPMMSRKRLDKSFQPISSILDFDFFKSYQLQPCESCSCNVSEQQQDADDLWMFGIRSNQEMHESCLKPIMIIERCRCFDWSDMNDFWLLRLSSSDLAEQLSKISSRSCTLILYSITRVRTC